MTVELKMRYSRAILSVFLTVIYFSPFSYSWPVPDTGQTKCYDNEKEIPCPNPGEDFYGQDGNYLINQPSYTKLDENGNDLSDSANYWAMVRDNVTGLIWEVKTDDGSIHDKDNRYTWYDSNPETNGGDSGTPGDGTDTEDFIAALNSANYGRFSDWHLPTTKELASIAHLGTYNPIVDTTYFPNTKSSNYWSSSSYAKDPDSAWLVYFNYNFVNRGNKSDMYYVRAVRSERSVLGSFDNLIINGDGTVTNENTGLMWQQTDAGPMTWDNTLSYSENLSLAGFTDWRLPTIEELRSIVDHSRYYPAVNSTFFPDTKLSAYWSSSSRAEAPNYAWPVGFSFGDGYNYVKIDTHYARSVRGGQVCSLGHLFISSPSQASFWDIGSAMPITWDTQSISGNVKISISRDGGKNFFEIFDDILNDGSHIWSVTGPPSVNCALKIEPLSEPSKTTIQSLFSITGISVSGYVRDTSGTAVSHQCINFSNRGFAITDISGYYIKYLPTNWSGYATLSKDGYVFAPLLREYTNIDSVISGQDFLAAQASYTGRVPDTGQTKCYNDAIEIPCPPAGADFYGQDGNYLINPPSYTKLDANGNDLPDDAAEWVMVRDNVTGLIWEVKTDDGSIHDWDDQYTWQDSQDVFIATLNTEKFGSFSDWRLPSLMELAFIANLDQYSPTIETDFFPNIQSYSYWSSSTPDYNSYAWRISFNYGYDYNSDKESSYYVCAVRGGQNVPLDRLIINGDGTITDISSGLMWQQSTSSGLRWENALSHGDNLTIAGYNDWRLPTFMELRSIVDYSKIDPAINSDFFPDTQQFVYLSSSSYVSNISRMWGIFTSSGFSHNFDKLSSYNVRALRGGQLRLSDHMYISSPVQASFWDDSYTMPIIWETQNISGNVKISLSRDGGKTFNKVIAESTPNDGSHEWSVTGPASYNCALKIEPLSDPNKSTIQSLFTIRENDAPPPNDNFINATSLTGQNIKTTGTNLNASKESGEPDHIYQTAHRSVWWKWTAEREGIVYIDTHGSDFDTILTVFTGGDLGALTLVTDNDNDTEPNSVSNLNFKVVAGTTYYIAVSGYEGSSGNIVLNLEQTGLMIESVQPENGVIGQPLNVIVTGYGFDDSTIVSMYPDGSPSEEIIVTSKTETPEVITATLTTYTSGLYTLKLTKETENYIFENAVTFVNPQFDGILNDKAIIINGKGPGADISVETKRCADTAYKALRWQDYEENDIFYLTFEEQSHGRNLNPTSDNLTSVFNTLFSNPPNRLVLYMVGHGDDDYFWLNASEKITAKELDKWLDALEKVIPGPVIFIYDACNSGSFIDDFKKESQTNLIFEQPRIVITSAQAGKDAIFDDFGSTTFSYYFWSAIEYGDTITDAFLLGAEKMKAFQTPLKDANSNADTNEEEDYRIADIYLSNAAYDPDKQLPVIASLSAIIQGVTIHIRACVAGDIESVQAVTIPPDFTDDDAQGGTGVMATLLSDNNGDNCYEGEYSPINVQGTYTVIIQAVASDGIQSPPRYVPVTNETGEATSLPDIYDMKSPSDDAPEQATPILFNNTVQFHNFHNKKDQDWVKFRAKGNTSYRFMAGNPSAICNPIIELYSKEDTITPIETFNEGITGKPETAYWRSPSPGFYYLRIKNADENIFGQNVSYDLSVVVSQGQPGFDIQFHISDFISDSGLDNAVIQSPELDIAEFPSSLTYPNLGDGVYQISTAGEKGNPYTLFVNCDQTHLPFSKDYQISSSVKIFNIRMMPVSLSGVLTIMKMMAGEIPSKLLMERCELSGDVDGKGNIGLEEVIYIMRQLSKTK